MIFKLYKFISVIIVVRRDFINCFRSTETVNIILISNIVIIEIQEEFNETRIVAEVVGLKVDEEVMTDGKVDYTKAGLVIYDTVTKCYRTVGKSIAAARSVGKKFDNN